MSAILENSSNLFQEPAYGFASSQAHRPETQWMQKPQAPYGCPPGLEYLSQINQLLVHQQVELLEGKDDLWYS